MPPTDDAYWLALSRVKGVGARTARLLLEKFGSPQKIFAAGEPALIDAGITRATARNIAAFRSFDALEKEVCELPKLGARLVKWTDSEYPENLRHIPDPPAYLFVRGTALAEERGCVAIVGARAASDAGRAMARRLGLELAAKGFSVVSGLARGIDAEAHQGALDAGGRTIAVLACGIDIIYPPEHRPLADSIVAKGGALMSELPIATPPFGENFPDRNRIIAGLSLGTVIVEAAEKSGSLITARCALEQNRQVFAVPGSPISHRARGSNRLLKEGARLVECAEDVIEDLAPQLVGITGPKALSVAPSIQDRGSKIRKASADISKDADTILKCLKDVEKTHVDSIIETSGLDAQTVLTFLLELELQGLVHQYPGKLFSLARL
jgi:DNA processing protein